MVGLGYLHYLADPAPTVGAIRSVDALPTLSVSAILSTCKKSVRSSTFYLAVVLLSIYGLAPLAPSGDSKVGRRLLCLVFTALHR